MKIRRRMKRTTKQYFMVAFICIIVIGGAAVFTAVVFTSQIKDEYTTRLADAYMDMRSNQRNVYVAVSDIMAGDFITNDNIEKKTVYTSQPEDTYLAEEDLGKVALVDISAGMQLLHNMTSENEVTSDLRELEYNVINISSNIVSNDSVDVRIFYPNGESYVVLSKKVINGLNPESTSCFFRLKEEEILRMSAAIVDAGLYTGSTLSTTKYIEPNIQEESAVTYTPSLSILTLLETNPNILERCSQELNKELRKALENRLANSMENDVSLTDWQINTDLIENANSNTEPKAITPAPTQEQSVETGKNESVTGETDEAELGNAEEKESNYLYYSQEENAENNVVDFGP